MSDLEKYLKGEPLNDELAALMEGRDLEGFFEEEEARPAAGRGLRRPLTDDDREELRRWRLQPGWQIMRRLVDAWMDRQETQIKELSLNDPLGNQTEVAKGWAYLAMQRRALQAMEAIIQTEVDKLKARPKAKRNKTQ